MAAGLRRDQGECHIYADVYCRGRTHERGWRRDLLLLPQRCTLVQPWGDRRGSCACDGDALPPLVSGNTIERGLWTLSVSSCRLLLVICRLDTQPQRGGTCHPRSNDRGRRRRNSNGFCTLVAGNIGKCLRETFLRRWGTLGGFDRDALAESCRLGHTWDDIGGGVSGRKGTRLEPRLPRPIRRPARVRRGSIL